jgi:leucyl-tRNA synthetase
MKEIDFRKIESKWQKRWEKAKIFEVKEDKKKKKFYVLEMFPYPSGSGLHMGHAFNYTIGDIFARFKRMCGFNALYPMGYDSFGLPAENAAIEAGIHPKKFTEDAIANFIRQQKSLGLSYDWDRVIMTHSPEYYRWNQFFFLKFFEKGLVYRKKAPVNYCPECNTALANEQVHNGKCWRHQDTDIEIRHLEQWFIKTTEYTEELLKFLPKLEWPERIRTMQENWIGKSFGNDVIFKINGKDWPIFTTRLDTIYGVTFMVISAQHPKLMKIVTEEQKKEVEAFLKKIRSTSEKEAELLEKEGVFTGSYAVNTVTGEKIPVYVGNFVIADYGSGMVMGVPAHDQRDFDFAKKYNILIKVVVTPEGKPLDTNKMAEAYVEDGVLINSDKFNGMKSGEAIEKISDYLEKRKLGKKSVQYKLKDWLISRQRYWGTPIPVVYCDKCGVVPVPEKELPVLLPEKVVFGKGNPLESSGKFLNTKCPKCGGKARRESDTMDTFFDSSWYFLRFCDNKNDRKPFDPKKVKYWMPIDQYIGGAEHACMHLIYARFFTKALRDLGFVKTDEPFTRLFNQGMLHGEDGFAMSKSRGNIVLPEEVSEKYGIDTARLFLVSIASPDKDIQWSENGIEGSFRFLKRIFKYFDEVKIGKSSKRIESKINKTVKLVTEHIDKFKYSLTILELRNLFDYMEKEVSKNVLETFLKLLHPFCPHITEELWEKIGNKNFISLEKWPVADGSKIDEKFEKLEKDIEKLTDDINNIAKMFESKGKKVSKAFIYLLPDEKKIYSENIDIIKKKINLEINIFVVNDKSKYDPRNRASKAKPGKPGIYLE